MKISKKTGKIKLEANEVRVGNFFVCRETDHMKLSDIHSVIHIRISRVIPVGIWLENIWERANAGEEAAEKTLQTYIAVMWSVLCVAPDDGFIQDAITMSEAALKRHPDWYGAEEGDEAGDEEATEELKEIAQLEEDIKNLSEPGDEEGD